MLRSKSPVPRRKRALSANFFNEDNYGKDLDARPLQLQSRHSETNLMRIDRDKTFNQNNVLENTGDLLAQVVFALNDFHSNKDDPVMTSQPSAGGVDLFSDESILEDEWSIITTPSDQMSQKLSNKLRSRTKSLYYPQISKNCNNFETNTPQFTWCGNNNDIQEYINAQVKNENDASKLRKMAKNEANGIVIGIEKVKDFDSGGNRRKSVFNAFNNLFKRRNTLFTSNVEASIETTESTSTPSTLPAKPLVLERSTSIKIDAVKKPQLNIDPKRRMSILSNQSSSSELVLETTTIADLIRAIESAHMNNMLGTKIPGGLTNRRMTMVPQINRRNSVAFSAPLETPPSNGSNYPRKSSLAVPRHRMKTMRQNSNPNRFSVTPVSVDTPTSAVSLSPIIQRRMRRLSTVPSITIMPLRRQSSSLQATPLALRRTQFKQTISPLAMSPTPETPTTSTKNSN